ncbi:MAG: hypothetical protein CO042_00835 [Parcubacteria group bacterium CG_4_9_14_0_2_um_filter_41_8]|nr:MAG: hypothetical protein CO042_00835 [Parcubacteria group bacterium CG_4_9_14_0_2_um_filter_41_8]
MGAPAGWPAPSLMGVQALANSPFQAWVSDENLKDITRIASAPPPWFTPKDIFITGPLFLQ